MFQNQRGERKFEHFGGLLLSGEAPDEHDIGKATPISPFCFPESKVAPGVPFRETRAVSEGHARPAVAGRAECGVLEGWPFADILWSAQSMISQEWIFLFRESTHDFSN